MPTLSLPVPEDFVLARDVCSYGYFLLEPNRWDVASQTLTRPFSLAHGPMAARLSQRGPGERLAAQLSRSLRPGERPEIIAGITRMLRLDESAEHIAAFHRADPRWKPSGRGRLFRSPSFFEDVIKTVTSCNVTWPGTVAMNRRLCEVKGKQTPAPPRAKGHPQSHPAPMHAFPGAAILERTKPALLRARCRVGYRDARIVELAQRFHSGKIDVNWFENRATPDDDIHAALLELPGVGPYAAANIMQLLGRYARLPLDTESVRHGRTILGFTGSPAGIMKRVREHFAPFGPHAFRSYWFEMWAHYEKVAGPAHTWEPKATANTFTAATLKKAAADAQRALEG